MPRPDNVGLTASQATQAVFRHMISDDAPALATLEACCFSTPWSEEQYRTAMHQQSFAAYGLWQEKTLLAYMTVYLTMDEVEVLNIAVLPELRRIGLGTRIMALVLQEAAKMGIQKALLEVRTGNTPAIALYESLGFLQAGLRKKYYADTGEDARIYVRDLATEKDCSL